MQEKRPNAELQVDFGNREETRHLLRAPQEGDAGVPFGHYCRRCGMPMPKERKSQLCPSCAETAMFLKVRDYIRNNDVTEFEVAIHFHIPLRLVKKWIAEGRIEYKNSENFPLNCEKCGRVIRFGKYCRKCQGLPSLKENYNEEEEEMRTQVIQDLQEKSAFMEDFQNTADLQ